MDANKILQQYVLIKPNNFGTFETVTPLQSLENVQIINKSVGMTNGKYSANYHYCVSQQSVGENTEVKKCRPLVMSKRNARERKRVKMINLGYETLRLHVPGGVENKKLSKVDTLRRAVDYIKYLQTVLDMETSCGSPSDIKIETNSEDDSSSQTSENMLNSRYQPQHGLVKENTVVGPSAGVVAGEQDSEMFIDIATWLLKTPNSYKSNIRLKDMGPNEQQLFSNLV